MVVLSEKEVSAGPEELWDTLRHLVDDDDVCTDDFTGIIVVSSPSGTGPRAAAGSRDASGGHLARFEAVYHLAGGGPAIAPQGRRELPSGPYFLSGPNLHQAWRLYPDDLEAFASGLIPEDVHEPQRYVKPMGTPLPIRQGRRISTLSPPPPPPHHRRLTHRRAGSKP